MHLESLQGSLGCFCKAPLKEFMVQNVWSMVHSTWPMVHNMWSMVHNMWTMVHNRWSMVHGIVQAFLGESFRMAVAVLPDQTLRGP